MVSKERIGKLERWILEQCLQDIGVGSATARRFYGKYFTPGEANKQLHAWLFREGREETDRLKEWKKQRDKAIKRDAEFIEKKVEQGKFFDINRREYEPYEKELKFHRNCVP